MRKPRTTIRHRGYLYAQGRTLPFDGGESADNLTRRRMAKAEDWRNGYLAAIRDVARRGKT